MAARIVHGEKPEQLTPVSAPNRLLFDWRQLKRWGIPEDKLPAGSLVGSREYTLWELYRGWIIGCLVLLGLQSGLIGVLLINRASAAGPNRAWQTSTLRGGPIRVVRRVY